MTKFILNILIIIILGCSNSVTIDPKFQSCETPPTDLSCDSKNPPAFTWKLSCEDQINYFLYLLDSETNEIILETPVIGEDFALTVSIGSMDNKTFLFMIMAENGDDQDLYSETAICTIISTECIDEICDGIDNDCDGEIDESVTMTFYQDKDADEYGDNNSPITACSMPAGYSNNNTDCDDANSSINPGITEICDDGIDQNCNGKDLPCVCIYPVTSIDGLTSVHRVDYNVNSPELNECI